MASGVPSSAGRINKGVLTDKRRERRRLLLDQQSERIQLGTGLHQVHSRARPYIPRAAQASAATSAKASVSGGGGAPKESTTPAYLNVSPEIVKKYLQTQGPKTVLNYNVDFMYEASTTEDYLVIMDRLMQDAKTEEGFRIASEVLSIKPGSSTFLATLSHKLIRGDAQLAKQVTKAFVNVSNHPKLAAYLAVPTYGVLVRCQQWLSNPVYANDPLRPEVEKNVITMMHNMCVPYIKHEASAENYRLAKEVANHDLLKLFVPKFEILAPEAQLLLLPVITIQMKDQTVGHTKAHFGEETFAKLTQDIKAIKKELNKALLESKKTEGISESALKVLNESLKQIEKFEKRSAPLYAF